MSASSATEASAESKMAYGGAERVAGRGGASSSTTCALVPPMPKELTPARRLPSIAGNGRSSPLTKNGVREKSMCGFGFA